MSRGGRETEQIIPGLYALSVGRADMPTPNGWRWVKLTDVARLESGHTPSRERPEYWNGDVPWVGIKDARIHHGKTIHDTLQSVTEEGLANSAARWLPAGTVCLSRTASVGYVTVLGRPMATSQDFVNWVCSEAIEPTFLMYLILAEGDHILKFGKGSTHTTIYFPEVLAFHVCLPPVAEQRRIVAKIEALTARSRRAKEALDAIPALLERFRQSVLAAAFRGDLTADWREKNPDVEPAEELLKRIRAERRRRWEEAELAKMRAKGKVPGDDRWKEKYEEPATVDASKLPELPNGWCWVSLETVGDVHLGRQRAPQYQTGRFSRPYLRVANIKDDRISFDDVLQMDFDQDEFNHYQLRPGDILLSEGQSPELVGQSAIYRGEIAGLCFQKTLHRFRAYPSATSPEFAQLLFRYYVRSGTFRSVSSLTVNIAHLTLVRLKPLHFPLPPAAEQAEIVRRATRFLGLVDRIEQRGRELLMGIKTLNCAILAKAFRGELVPQDPNDEPASVLLERLRAEREQNGKPTNGASRRRAAASPPPAASNPAAKGGKPRASRRSEAPARSRG